MTKTHNIRDGIGASEEHTRLIAESFHRLLGRPLIAAAGEAAACASYEELAEKGTGQ